MCDALGLVFLDKLDPAPKKISGFEKMLAELKIACVVLDPASKEAALEEQKAV